MSNFNLFDDDFDDDYEAHQGSEADNNPDYDDDYEAHQGSEADNNPDYDDDYEVHQGSEADNDFDDDFAVYSDSADDGLENTEDGEWMSEIGNELEPDENEDDEDHWEEDDLARLQTSLQELGFEDDEIEEYIEQLHELDDAYMGKNRFGSIYGGLVCLGGSINCTGCYGPLMSNSGICRNA